VVNLLDFDLEGLIGFCADLGEKRFRAVQLFRWIHQKGESDFDRMSDLAKSFRSQLQSGSKIEALELISEKVSADGTVKWLFDVGAGNAIETVFIPEHDRGTLCVSSQAGCAVGCRFCSTGHQGFSRNLATGEIVAVFDADFIVPEDFLKKTVHYFADPKVGVVQTRWTYLNTHYNMLTEVQTILLDGHFVLEHVARAGAGLFFNFNGTAGLLRVKMIEDAGGWQHDTLTEDSDLSYRAQLKGWKFMYCPDVECPSELPFDMHGFQVQQTRWSKGLTQCAKKLLPMILKSEQPWRVKLEAICHLTPNIAYPLMLIMSALMLPVMIVRFYMGWMQMVFVDLPLMAASFWSISAFYLVAQKQLHPTTWKRSIWHMPALMAAGVALTLSNAKAVMEALVGYQTAFARTPKYAVGDKKVKLGNDRYKSRLGWLPYVEIAAGSWFVLMMVYAIESYNFLALPFLSLFVGVYYWAAFSKFWFDYQQRMAWQKQRALALESAR